MVSAIQTCVLLGLEPHLVTCEVDLSEQLSSITLIGLPSHLTQESKDRVRIAVKNSGLEWPERKVTINLLPAQLPKWGSHFEVAMALGVLLASGGERLREGMKNLEIFCVGELSLTGKIRPNGWLPAIYPWLMRRGQKLLVQEKKTFVLIAHPNDFAMLDDVKSEMVFHLSAESLAQALSSVQQLMESEITLKSGFLEEGIPSRKNTEINFQTLKEVRDEPLGVFAAIVALLQRHHAIFVGPHGMGKSMLVEAICEAKKSLTTKEQALRSAILGVFQGFCSAESLKNPRPVAKLQPSITRAALEGTLLNSGQILPGELTRAHLGIVVADEFLEIHRDVLEALRLPLEDDVVRLQRAKFRTELPAQFQLLATSNLCPCGLYGSPRKKCRCNIRWVKEYQRKFSGPIYDRFDLVVKVGDSDRETTKIQKRVYEKILEVAEAPSSWGQRLEKAEQVLADSTSMLFEGFDQSIPFEVSHRSKEKLKNLTRAVAALYGETPALVHLQIACWLRRPAEEVYMY